MLTELQKDCIDRFLVSKGYTDLVNRTMAVKSLGALIPPFALKEEGDLTDELLEKIFSSSDIQKPIVGVQKPKQKSPLEEKLDDTLRQVDSELDRAGQRSDAQVLASLLQSKSTTLLALAMLQK